MTEVSATDNIGSSLIKSMNVGSGVDISELAEALANADTAPSIATKTTQKDDATAAISGLGILKSSLSNFSQSVDTMTDKSSLTDKSVASQNENRVEAKITAQTKVQAGTHKLQCRQLARAQINELKMASGSFSSDAQALNGGSAFNLSIASPAGGSATTVAVTTATPAGIVDAINAANVNGIRAYTMNMASSGTAISIMIEGKTGVANTFTVTDASSISSPSTLITQDTSNDIQGAADLKLVVNKPSDTSEFVFRDTNSPSDVIAGVQLNFKQADNTDPYTTTNIVIAEDRAAFTTAMTNMQAAYNDLVQTIGVLDGSVESESTYAGNLKKEKSTLRGIVQNIRAVLTNDSSTPSDPIKSMRQLGVGFDLNGNLTIQRTRLDAAVVSNFSDITKMLTANTDDQSSFSSAAKGLAQDVVNVVDDFNGVTGIVSIKTDSNTKLVRDLTTQLEDLQSKYESSRKRYLQQFAAMESLVQSSKSTGDYLTQQFKAMNGDN